MEEVYKAFVRQTFKDKHKEILSICRDGNITMKGLADVMTESGPNMAYYLNGNKKWDLGLVTIGLIEWYSDKKSRRPYLLRTTGKGLKILEFLN